jgi:hypothetical protein
VSARPTLSPDTIAAKLRYVAAAFGTVSDGNSVSVTREGTTFTFQAYMGRNTSWLKVETRWRMEPKSDAGLIRFVREQAQHRFAKRIGLAGEPELCDPTFDRAVYVETWIDRGLIPALLDVETRRAVVALLHDGWRSVSLQTKTIEVIRNLTLEAMSAADLERTMAHLLYLVRAARRIKEALPSSRPSTLSEKIVLPAIAVMLFSPIGWMSLSSHEFLPGCWPYLTSVLLGLAFALAVSVAIGFKVRGSSAAWSELVACAGLLLPAMPMSMIVLLPWLNRWLDYQPPHRYPTVVLQVQRPAKGGTVVVLRGVAGDASEIRVSGVLHPSLDLKPGARVTLVVHDGLFGWPYLERVE